MIGSLMPDAPPAPHHTLRWLALDGDEFIVRPYAVDAYPRFDPNGPEASLDLARLALVDTETLGLDPADPIIEVAIRRVAYDRSTGTLYGMTDEYVSFDDPARDVPPEITKLTGITNADVHGQRIDRSRVRELLNDSALVIAHNASFDRPRIDALVEGTNVPWACSSTMIAWRDHGLPSASLVALCLAHGFYCTAHRALGDVAALLRLLSIHNAETQRSYFSELLEEARKPAVEVFAWGSPFHAKDRLKARGYKWRDGKRVWVKTMLASEADGELSWLASEGGTTGGSIVPIDPRKRFTRT